MHCLVTSLKKKSFNLDSKNGDRDRIQPVAIIRVKDGDSVIATKTEFNDGECNRAFSKDGKIMA